MFLLIYTCRFAKSTLSDSDLNTFVYYRFVHHISFQGRPKETEQTLEIGEDKGKKQSAHDD